VHESLLAGQMSADYTRAVQTINLSDDELAAGTATVRRAIEDDRFPHAPRLDPLRAALGKFDAAAPEPPPRRPRQPSQEAGAAITDVTLWSGRVAAKAKGPARREPAGPRFRSR
jgi:hypothetical protein